MLYSDSETIQIQEAVAIDFTAEAVLKETEERAAKLAIAYRQQNVPKVKAAVLDAVKEGKSSCYVYRSLDAGCVEWLKSRGFRVRNKSMPDFCLDCWRISWGRKRGWWR